MWNNSRMSFMSTYLVCHKKTGFNAIFDKTQKYILLSKIQTETTADTADWCKKCFKKEKKKKKRIKINEHYNKMGLIVNLLQKFHIQRIQNDRFISHNNRSFK